MRGLRWDVLAYRTPAFARPLLGLCPDFIRDAPFILFREEGEPAASPIGHRQRMGAGPYVHPAPPRALPLQGQAASPRPRPRPRRLVGAEVIAR